MFLHDIQIHVLMLGWQTLYQINLVPRPWAQYLKLVL